MNTYSSLFLLGALGALSAAASSAVAAVDTSQWKCETCPFEKAGVSGTLDAGALAVSDDSAKFGDYTGLNKKGGYVIAGGTYRYRSDNGQFGNVTASDLGLDTRTVAADFGQEGLYALRFGYAEIPRYQLDGARSPFLGAGSGQLSLPPGFPAPTTTAMPLAGTLQPVELESKRAQLDAGVAWFVGPGWSTRLNLRRDVRDGTQRFAGSFFSTASHLAAPVDTVTDQLEVSASYASSQWQATVAYQVSLFRNGEQAVTWANPFTPVVAGANSGQMALAPDNQFHQIMATGSYEITPQIRASGDIAIGRMTQDSAYLAATLNPNLAVPALPASSLQGRADTFNASVRLTATPTEPLRVNASYARDVRDNQTPSLSYPAVSTDMFLGAVPRINQPFSFTQDRFKLNADYRGPGSLKSSAGIDQDYIARTLQEVVTTRETKLWGRVGGQAMENLSLSLELAHAQRDPSTYGIATWVTPPENPLLRKFNLAERTRDMANLRADFRFADNVSVGLHADVTNDDYTDTTVGLTEARSNSLGADLSVAISDVTQLHLYAQGEQVRSRQAGSQAYAQADWWANSDDDVSLVGVGIKHLALGGKLELGADLVFARSHSDVVVNAGAASPPFPTATTSLDSLKLRATYRVNEKMSVVGSYWYQQYDAQDWRYDGVAPDTLANLLAFGEQSPRYRVNVLGLALRYRF